MVNGFWVVRDAPTFGFEVALVVEFKYLAECFN